MNVLVTGGAGFIGSNIVKGLLNAGHTPIVLDDLRAKVNFAPKGVPLLQVGLSHYGCGIGNRARLPHVEAIVHCAARADIKSNWDNIEEREALLQSNVTDTIHLLELHPRTPVVFLSTAAVYGDTPPNHASHEDEPCIAKSPYAASKLSAEAYLQAYSHAHQSPLHIFRLAAVIGKNYHHGHIQDFVRMAKATNAIHARSDGLAERTAVHVDDVTNAVLNAFQGLQPGTYNLGAQSWTWRDTFHVMTQVAGRPIPLTFEPVTHGWVGDPMAVTNGTKYAAATGKTWKPVKEGVLDALYGLGWPNTHHEATRLGLTG